MNYSDEILNRAVEAAKKNIFDWIDIATGAPSKSPNDAGPVLSHTSPTKYRVGFRRKAGGNPYFGEGPTPREALAALEAELLASPEPIVVIPPTLTLVQMDKVEQDKLYLIKLKNGQVLPGYYAPVTGLDGLSPIVVDSAPRRIYNDTVESVWSYS
jgi:hypothetical protein